VVATYRLQLGPSLTFADARTLVPYLRRLGISHIYLSPVLQARPGSEHGYDVLDPLQISEDLGGEDELRRLCSSGLGMILDVVPNHMAADEGNPFWPDPRVFDLDPEGGYRRFFDIDELAGVRQEDPEVFELTHRKVFDLVREGLVDGLRIDHVDGLADPAGYLERLRDSGVERIWVEKILEPGERLRDWPVEGTTGYEFANDVTALFVDPTTEELFTGLYDELTGERRTFGEVAREAKLEQVETTFGPEVERLRRLWDMPELERALASFDVYRTYVDPQTGRYEEADRDAFARARLAVPFEEVLDRREFLTRFQQATGPVMAKGVEDTAFYRYNRLVALNEVGGNPATFGLPVEDFHRGNAERAERFPLHMLATTTHDTKRSGDVRARIVALTWLAQEWNERVRGWHALDDPNEDYLLWQTLVGTWPIERERLEAYFEKALREAKRTTNWIEPNEAHEASVRCAIGRLYEDGLPAGFESFAARVAELGRTIALRMTLLKLTVPGVPDIYQGDEREALLLVDPDNRRPVPRPSDTVLQSPEPKTELILRVLAARRERSAGFADAYVALEAGPDVCAFRRGSGVIVVVPLRPGWETASIEGAEGRWNDLLSGEELRLGASAALRSTVRSPVGALLVRD
jgi:(1->4)-alpha-D-glucan 1-alpha-D-glucosylmutase